ncbi:ABC transporter substrate-binding protein [Endomicrobium proavitum]|uniref:Maltose transporter subunit n=1 Tax=Endomicrobium proavitum TaxID=1408281 RepID=A0A0G3WGG4_9BACT|nr:extracellular solute-binding protein [Endomicrobium proavitum]AKL97766.1 maltose transporter subunit [Endomicrobium proavitum]
MSKFKVAVSALMCLFVTAGIIAGCGSKEKKAKADVVIWHWMTDRQAAFETLAEQYFKETGVKVLFETYAPTDVYRNKISAAATANLLPDVFNPIGDKKEVASYIKAGFIANLNDSMNKDGWKNVFFKKAIENNSFEAGNEWGVEPGIYAIPLDVTSLMIFYNKDLFTQAGLDPENTPKTWPEFINAGKKLRAAGIQPFVSGFGEGWLIGAFAQSYQWNLFGKQGIIDTLDGKIPYTDARWVRIFKLFAEMRDNKLFASGIVTMINKDAERSFATGKSAMAFNGSWGVNVYQSMNPKLNYGVMSLPSLPEAKYPLKIFGGEGSSLYVNASSPNKDKAIEFLKWMTQKGPQAYLAKETLNIPSNQQVANDLPPALKVFSENIANTFDTLPSIEPWQVINFININLQSVIIGERTPEAAAKEVQAEKVRQTKAAK